MPRKGEKRPKPPVGDVRDPDSLYHHMRRYLAHLAEKNYSPRTIEEREKFLRYFIQWCDDRGITRPRQLDRGILERYQRHLFYWRKANGEPLSIGSQLGRITPIRHCLQWLVKQRHLLYNPASDLDMPRIEKRLPKAILTAREAEAVLAVPQVGNSAGLRDRAMLETFYSTGMRRSELARLKFRDLDFERGTVMIRQGKGRKDRMIPIGERALLWIEAYRDRARPELLAGPDDGTVFLSQLGLAFEPGRITDRVRRYVDEANIGKKGSCHLFRHTMATLMLENGADIRFIQAMLGHASLDTTQIYAQVGIRVLKTVHAATHPGRMPEVGKKTLEEDAGSTVEELMEALAREAEEDGE